ncbi:MAG: hypothetical protein RLZZ283_757 [Candidatus Parcubacteria bacterium]
MFHKRTCEGVDPKSRLLRCPYGSALAPEKALQRPQVVGPCKDGCLEIARERQLHVRMVRKANEDADIGTDWPPLGDEARPLKNGRRIRVRALV